jgi:adenylate cyclase class 2
MSKVGVTFARLRTQGGKHLFTLKRPVDNELDCEEYECEISDRDRVHDALVASGFHPTVRINKTRRTATSGPLSLCLDEVEGAGTFVEVERVVDAHESGARIQAELDHFAQTLGTALERTMRTYDSLVRAPTTSQI